MSEAPVRAKLTVLETVYHQRDGKEPVSFGSPFEQILLSREQPYHREAEADTAWSRVDTAWVREPGLVLVENVETAYNPGTVPTPETISEVSRRVLELSFSDPAPEDSLRRTMHSPYPEERTLTACLLVHPGRSVRLHLPPGKVLWARAAAGVASCRFVVTAFPSE